MNKKDYRNREKLHKSLIVTLNDSAKQVIQHAIHCPVLECKKLEILPISDETALSA